jgi:Glycosyltransferase 61
MNSVFHWPRNIKDEDRHAFSKEIQKDPGIQFRLHIVRNAMVTRWGIFHHFFIPSKLGFPGSELLRIMHWRYRRWIERFPRFLAYYARFLLSPFRATRRIPAVDGEKLVMISDQWSDYYFHWFTDALPRLIRLLEHGSIERNEIRVVLPCNHNLTFIKKSLDFLGFRYLLLEPGFNHYFTHLYIPSHCGRPGSFNYPLEPTGLALKQCAARHMRPPSGKRLYISRARARCRLVTNEEDVTALLKEFGFEVVYFEEHPWEKQLEMVSEASVILGPHGAGFTHMYFLKTGSDVVEMRVADTDDHNNCLFNMANSLGHHYHYLFCKRAGVCDIPGDDNLIVDTDALRQLLLHLPAWPQPQTG